MKNISLKNLLFGSLLSIPLFFMTSCEEDAVDEIINEMPLVEISNPTETVFSVSDTIIFVCVASDKEDGELDESAIVWNSDRDGFLGNGLEILLSKLSLNDHVITVTVSDSEGLQAIDSVHIKIIDLDMPLVEIVSPADSAEYAIGELVTFSCTATDRVDGELSDNSIRWNSSLSGVLGFGKTVQTSTLDLGVHEVTVTASDASGNEATQRVTLFIKDIQAPAVTITNIENGAQFSFNSIVMLNCSVSDDVDGSLNENAVVWSSDIDGVLGTGLAIQAEELSLGEHLIVVTATDFSGNSGADTINIIIYQDYTALNQMMSRMTGKFSSENQASTSSDPYHYDVRRKAQRIWPNETDGYWLYLEQAFAGSESAPYFQRVYHFYMDGDTIRNQVYSINSAAAFVGSWETPEDFDAISISDLSQRENCGSTFILDTDHFYGSTRGKDCVSTLAGVSYMTSEQWIYENNWNSYDLGWNANDVIVMGPYSPYVFDKLEDFPFIP